MKQPAKDRVRFACDECDQLLSIGTSRIGQTVTCPKCSCKNTVPSAEAAAAQLAERKRRKQARQEESQQDFSQFEVYDDDTEFIFETEEGEGYYGGKVDRSKVAVSRTVLYIQGGLLGFVAIAAFAFGWFVGAMTAGPAHSPVEDNTPKVVRGTITYEDAAGQAQPDADSVVILLPQDNRPASGEKIEVAGLRPSTHRPMKITPVFNKYKRWAEATPARIRRGSIACKSPSGAVITCS